MLKLSFHSITNFACLEDFFLISYIFIDELYQAYVPEHIRYRKNYQKALLSDSEVITLSLCGKLLDVTELIREKMIQPFLETECLGIVGSFLLPVCHFGCAAFCRSFRYEGATYGICASKRKPILAIKYTPLQHYKA